ncbi:MAG: hypothetical protein WC654_02775 [Patescibacteria group bacterium]
MGQVLGFVGWPCAGKDVAAEYLRDRYGAVWHDHSNFIRALAHEHGVRSPSTTNFSFLFEARASHAGRGWIAQIVTDRTKALSQVEPCSIVVITGVRNLAEVEIYRELEGFQLVRLEADRALRFRRWCDQPRASNEPRPPAGLAGTWEQFLSIEAFDGNANVPDVLALADSMVENNGTPEELYRALDALMSGA